MKRDNLQLHFLPLPGTTIQSHADSPHLQLSTHSFSRPTLGFIPLLPSWHESAVCPRSQVGKVPLPAAQGSALAPQKTWVWD